MKKITTSLFMIMLLGVVSCNDFLDVPLKGNISTDVFASEQAVTGCYAAFYSNDKDWQIWEAWHIYAMGNILSDDAYKGGQNDGDQPDLGIMERFETLPSNPAIRSVYRLNYHYIFFFNTALEGLSKATDVSESIRDRYIGEVKFLRAYAYMRIMMAYGSESKDKGLPIIDHVLLQSEMGKVPRSNFMDTWNFIINELKDAEARLPVKSSYPVDQVGRATKGAAQALLTRSYLYTKDWVNCEAYASKVIDSKEYRLAPEFKDVFSKDKEHGVESIFELGYTIDKYFGTGYDFSHASWWASAQQPRGAYGGWGLSGLSKDLLTEFEQNPGDPRIVWTFLFEGDEDVSKGNASVVSFSGGLNPDKMHLRKLWDPLNFLLPVGQTDYNYTVIRYADVLLMYAEAANENGKIAQAQDALNTVRKRARESSFTDPYRNVKGYEFDEAMDAEDRVPDVTAGDKTSLRNAIWHERRVELAGENLRFFDLVRQGRAGSVLRSFAAKYSTLKGKAFQDGKHESFPIPQDEVALSNSLISQNPGY
ncbi:RagB/SusD family nutrient uptake outer membrane protein [Chryseolinea lacunae]|uniref:RagB/SusD family nutrient uptake outer membrane protein n=1 Tax=Chryseolinea lacunae TaxID=2801331 RepID=A0ABS1KUB9_9BACT|nr:RagB/SusD family nutrient uptake outer membrane protein [Chryseolinea lacunae]MBL0743040.1 RagB/SusD family nutrient uptake outer membrane protein [Chryseolinea lacunae]